MSLWLHVMSLAWARVQERDQFLEEKDNAFLRDLNRCSLCSKTLNNEATLLLDRPSSPSTVSRGKISLHNKGKYHI